jgi:UDP-glucose 4-epimerase
VVAAELIAAGHAVTVFDNLSHGHREAIPAEATFIEGDLGDRAAVHAALKDNAFDAVLHFAAFIEAGESMKSPASFFQNNTVLTLQLLEAMNEHGIRRFVFSSTAALYGNPKEVPITEDAELKPTNPYGESKLLVEQALAWHQQCYGLRYASLRYFNAAGAAGGRGEAHQPESHLIPRVLAVALGQSEKVTIFGTDYPTPDGTCVRDYIHLLDLASAHLLALNALADSEVLIYNLGSGEGFSIRDVIETARRVTGHPIPAVEAPRRPGDPAFLVASSRKIRKQLGWKPRHTTLESILASAWAWHKSHPNGYGG